MDSPRSARTEWLYAFEVVLMCFLLAALDLCRSCWQEHRYARFAALATCSVAIIISTGYIYRRSVVISVSKAPNAVQEEVVSHKEQEF